MPRRGTHNIGDLVEWFNAVGIIEDVREDADAVTRALGPEDAVTRVLVRFITVPPLRAQRWLTGETYWITVNSRMRVISQA